DRRPRRVFARPGSVRGSSWGSAPALPVERDRVWEKPPIASRGRPCCSLLLAWLTAWFADLRDPFKPADNLGLGLHSHQAFFILQVYGVGAAVIVVGRGRLRNWKATTSSHTPGQNRRVTTPSDQASGCAGCPPEPPWPAWRLSLQEWCRLTTECNGCST